ncbi:hypothetical protein AB835_06165 [Candidatus Endobugula sertula]|uniref:Ferredoxin n=1 Tax=Candidatus Endobugula sertula TaxID=62101 RepID=A0A1D2QQW1_9GAMM|nr:hypothetical protein AB835_06165 [Candidatus Endobugula sertula]
MDNQVVLQCKNIVDIADDMKKIVFKVLSNQQSKFLPGCHLKIKHPDMNGNLQLRHYSLTNICQNTQTVSISVKKESGQGVSPFIFENIKPGSLIWSEGVDGVPFGSVAGEKIFIFCSGAGITPVISLLNDIAKVKGSEPELLRIFYSVKNMGKAYYLNDLMACYFRYEWLDLHVFISRENVIDKHSFVKSGRVSVERVKSLLSAPANNVHFFGSQGFIKNMKSDYGEFCCEDFPVNPESKKSIVISNRNQKAYFHDHQSALSLLEILEDNGINVKSNCRSGFCGHCKVKLNKGRATTSGDSCGLTDAEKNQGYILACCTKPVADVDISL